MTAMVVGSMLVAWLACVPVVVAEEAAGERTEAMASPVDYYAHALNADPDFAGGPRDVLLRIRRDFNNDGRDDEAIALQSGCGNKMCSFDLWLQDEGRRFQRVGTLWILPWGYGLVPRSPGVAELQQCSGTGVEFYGMSAETISLDGVVPDAVRSKALSAAGRCELVELDSYPCESCPAKELRKTRRCRWKPCE